MTTYKCNRVINVSGLYVGSGIVELKIADGDTERTFHIDGHDAAMIGEYGQGVLLNAGEKWGEHNDPVSAFQDWESRTKRQPPPKRNFCPECGTRCEYCPECGEKLR